jgi:septal ring factor EnvC (AmiA/AmiB activator)
MYWWIIAVVCICGALLIQYICSSKILRMKQDIAVKSLALREARTEGQRLDEQSLQLKNQKSSLTRSIRRLGNDIKVLVPQMQEQGLEIPEPTFSMADLDDDSEEQEQE